MEEVIDQWYGPEHEFFNQREIQWCVEFRTGVGREIHLQDSSHSEPTHIDRGNYIANVLQGSTAYRFWYYIIQRKGSKELIDLVKFDTYEQAIASARELLAKLNRGVGAD